MNTSAGSTLADAVIEYVRGEMHDRKMIPGELYSVYQLSDTLGISRSPVRDGLLRLEEAGIVRFVKNRGFEILPANGDDVAEIFSIRLSLEPLGAFRAARHRTATDLDTLESILEEMQEAALTGDEASFFTADRRFHESLLLIGKAPRSAKLIEQMRFQTRLLGPSTAMTETRSLQDILAEHSPVFEAVKSGDDLGAASAMKDHLVTTGKLLLSNALERSGDTRSVQQVWDDFVTDSDLV